MNNIKITPLISFMLLLGVLTACTKHQASSEKLEVNAWQLYQTNLDPRHESALFVANKRLFLIGGRGLKPSQVYNQATKSWDDLDSQIPFQIHHFQASTINMSGNDKNPSDRVFIIGAFTENWPQEKPVEKVIEFDPESGEFSQTTSIPRARLRGAAATAVHDGKVYIVGGSTNGHISGTVAWLDEYDPKTKRFTRLADAPIARDHSQVAVVDNKLYVIGGRQTSRIDGNAFNLTIAQVDVYDFAKGTWTTLPSSANLPTPRAGGNLVVLGQHLVLIGGESEQRIAHEHVQAFDTKNHTWLDLAPLNRGRHSGGAAIYNEQLIVASGSGNRGGRPELDSIEIIPQTTLLSSKKAPLLAQQNQTVSLSLRGESTKESDISNPFTEYVLLASFTHQDGSEVKVRGFYAADGKAQFSSASSGDIWQVNFVPEKTGIYDYSLALYKGKDIALFNDLKSLPSERQLINMSKGQISVSSVNEVKQKADAQASSELNFLQNGFLRQKNGFFYFPQTDKYWLKMGSNSPENFLAYHEIDGTYRHPLPPDSGVSKAPKTLHHFELHEQDYEVGNPLWGQDANKGKGIIGAINYIASQGLNAQYFVTLNINGDGRDVWPYISHDDYERFDVSKLAQWNMIFEHMQNKGILLHIVTQETENETLLDNGDVGRLRSLYYLELIARFAHHKALVWNLGEENGPAHWSPSAQNDVQRKAMAAFFAKHDPYKHPILIHTHADKDPKDEILIPLYNSDFTGVSMQIGEREDVFTELTKWRSRVSDAKLDWLLSMDEIGKWYTGARIDANDPTHDSLRRYVLWPALMAGASGIEWYSGSQQPHNDLSLEDYRTRENLYEQSLIAKNFFEQHIPWWQLTPQASKKDGRYLEITYPEKQYSANYVPAATHFESRTKELSLIYLQASASRTLTLPSGQYQSLHLNPQSGVSQNKGIVVIKESEPYVLTNPSTEDDLVVLLKWTSSNE